MQHGIPADPVLLLQVSDRRQGTSPPLARLDTPAEDRFKLLVRRNGQTRINRANVAHTINLDDARPALTSTYIYVALL